MDFVLNTEFVIFVVGVCSIMSTDPGFTMTVSSHLNTFVESPESEFEAHSKELVPSTCDMPYKFYAEDGNGSYVANTLIFILRACYGVLRFVMESGAKGCEGVLGIKVKIMLDWDPKGKQGPTTPLPDVVTIHTPKEEEDYVHRPALQPMATDVTTPNHGLSHQ